MIFECERKGKHTVWNAKEQNVLCVFENGKYETSDEIIIKMLKIYGYKTINEEKKENEKHKVENNEVEKPKRKYNRRSK